MSNSDDLYAKAVEINEIITAIQEFEQETSFDLNTELQTLELPAFEDLNDAEQFENAEEELSRHQRTYENVARQLVTYREPSRERPLERLQSFLQDATSYTPTWEPAEEHETAKGLGNDLKQSVGTLKRALKRERKHSVVRDYEEGM